VKVFVAAKPAKDRKEEEKKIIGNAGRIEDVEADGLRVDGETWRSAKLGPEVLRQATGDNYPISRAKV
jgi:hypothetical protein